MPIANVSAGMVDFEVDSSELDFVVTRYDQVKRRVPAIYKRAVDTVLHDIKAKGLKNWVKEGGTSSLAAKLGESKITVNTSSTRPYIGWDRNEGTTAMVLTGAEFGALKYKQFQPFKTIETDKRGWPTSGGYGLVKAMRENADKYEVYLADVIGKDLAESLLAEYKIRE